VGGRKHTNNQQHHHPGPKDRQPTKPARTVVTNIPQPFSVIQQSTPDEEARYIEERCSRRRQLAMTILQNVITCVGIVLALLSLSGLHSQVQQSNSALQQAQQALQVRQRAWMKVEVIWPAKIPMDGHLDVKISNV
jgi:hypothetical protein